MDQRHKNRSCFDEDALLQSALSDSDGLLTNALRTDERRRRSRRLVVWSLYGGLFLMGTILLILFTGGLTLFTPPPADAVERVALAKKRATLTEDERIARGEQLSKQAWALWQQQKFDEAAKKFQAALEFDSGDANSWNGLGWASLNSGNAEEALKAFEKCVALDPSHPAGLNGLGQTYLSQREYAKAEKFLLKAAPNAPAAHFGLARLYLLTGKYDKAKPWIEKALAAQPNEEMLKQWLAAAEKGELTAELRQQIEPPPVAADSTAQKLAGQGWQQFNSGNPRSAERSFRQALAKDPENLSAMNGLGFLLLNTGKTAEAKSLFEKCLEVEPDAAGPMNGLARCLKAEGKVDEAIALWEKMSKKYPGPTAATVGLATTYLEKKEYAKALPYFEELVKSQPDNAEFKQGLEDARKNASLERLRVQGEEIARDANKK